MNWIYNNVWDFEDMSNLPKNTKELLKQNFHIEIPRVINLLESKIDGTKKFLLAYNDDNIIECVVMQYSFGNSICVSTQVGCRMGCKFCASTIDGMLKNLSSGQILAQILITQKYLNIKISNIVLMGSGEPLDNYENVSKFLFLVNEDYGLNIGQRHITLSTCGIVPKIKELAQKKLQITLAISLHAPNDEKRKQMMPIANKYSINELLEACKYYIENTGRRITFEYALVKNSNDSMDDAYELSSLLKGMLCHVNLIPVNKVTERDYEKPSEDDINKFSDILKKKGIPVTTRREMGSDINAACGQLRRNYINNFK
jgi:23S rRNA (adenine2503-C2)-methyltransferase